jgi:ketosteroid isomerase-like protein
MAETLHTDPLRVARTYLDSWAAGDFDTLRGLFADDVTFRGVLGSCDGIDETVAGLQGMGALVDRFDVQKMIADDTDVITWYDFRTTTGLSMPTVNWSHLNADGRIDAIRVVFDPRELLASSQP